MAKWNSSPDNTRKERRGIRHENPCNVLKIVSDKVSDRLGRVASRIHREMSVRFKKGHG